MMPVRSDFINRDCAAGEFNSLPGSTEFEYDGWATGMPVFAGELLQWWGRVQLAQADSRAIGGSRAGHLPFTAAWNADAFSRVLVASHVCGAARGNNYSDAGPEEIRTIRIFLQRYEYLNIYGAIGGWRTRNVVAHGPLRNRNSSADNISWFASHQLPRKYSDHSYRPAKNPDWFRSIFRTSVG